MSFLHVNKLIRIAVLLSLTAAAFGQGTISGQLQTATGGAVSNGTLSFTLSQPSVVSGTASLVSSPAACYTSNAGNVVGIPDPILPPVLSTNTASGTLGAGTYYVKIYYTSATGNSASSPEAIVSLTSTGTVIVAAPALQPTAATGYGVAISASSGTETIQGTVTGWTSYQQASALSVGSNPPTTNGSSCKLYFSDQLIPTGTYYTVNLLNKNGSQIAGYPQTWCTYGGSGGTINVSQGAPTGNCNVSGVFYPTPIFANPFGGSSQSINSNLSLTANLNVAGTSTLGTTKVANTGNFTNVLPITDGLTSTISGCNPDTNFGVQGGKGYTNAIVACTDLPNGATNLQSNGVASYVTTVADSRVINPGVIGGGPNGVAFYGTMEVNGNYAAGWASNLVLACGGGASTTAMKCIGNETDIQYNGGSSLLGTAGALEPMLVTGNAIGAAIPVNAIHPALNSAFLAIQTGVTCSGCTAGTGPYPYAYSAFRGFSQKAFFAGATCFTGFPCGSQNFVMESYDASGNRREANIGATQDGDIYLFPAASSNRVLEIPGAGGGLTLAQLNGLSNLVNGMVAFCGDCTNQPGGHTAGAICAGSGTGATAMRENGQWNCF